MPIIPPRQEENEVGKTAPESHVFSTLKKNLLNAKIVICNIHNCNLSLLKNCDFQKLILYNAHNISECAAVQALQKNVSQCVLLGDHTLRERVVNEYDGVVARSRAVSQSIFETLVRKNVRPVLLTLGKPISNNNSNDSNCQLASAGKGKAVPESLKIAS